MYQLGAFQCRKSRLYNSGHPCATRIVSTLAPPPSQPTSPAHYVHALRRLAIRQHLLPTTSTHTLPQVYVSLSCPTFLAASISCPPCPHAPTTSHMPTSAPPPPQPSTHSDDQPQVYAHASTYATIVPTRSSLRTTRQHFKLVWTSSTSFSAARVHESCVPLCAIPRLPPPAVGP